MSPAAVIRGLASLKRIQAVRLCENQWGGLQETRPKTANQVFATILPSRTNGRIIRSGSFERKAGVFMV